MIPDLVEVRIGRTKWWTTIDFPDVPCNLSLWLIECDFFTLKKDEKSKAYFKIESNGRYNDLFCINLQVYRPSEP
jgi:hypothetical protein